MNYQELDGIAHFIAYYGLAIIGICVSGIIYKILKSGKKEKARSPII